MSELLHRFWDATRFATWHHLRRLRRTCTPGQHSDAGIRYAKQDIPEAIKFLTWLHSAHQRTASTCLQQDVDEWLASGPTTRSKVRNVFACAKNARLNRPRHSELIEQVRDTGARIRLISDGDVAGAIAAARPESGTDILLGTGGTPEGIIAAAAMRCLGGVLQGRLAPTDDAERQKAIDAGHDLDRILGTQDLVAGENVFFTATGITDGDLLRGVRYSGGGAQTQSIVMRSKSGTVRMIDAEHRISKLREFSAVGHDNGSHPPIT
jgi:hypothetical protein